MEERNEFAPYPEMSYSKEVYFLRYDDDVYMLRPYYTYYNSVSYGVYKQTEKGFDKVCCIDCLSYDSPDEIFANLRWHMNDDCEWNWQRAENIWKDDFSCWK